MADEYNKTQLHPDKTFERHVFHRDQFAHFLRWSHVLKEAEIGERILDVGCGNANMLLMMYANRYKPQKYVGVDVRKKTMEACREKFKDVPFKAEFHAIDAVTQDLPREDFSMITCFEVVEHIQKKNVRGFLENIKKSMGPKTRLFISTPCYDEKTGAAENHIIDGQVCELTYDEMKDHMESLFSIKGSWGTFASQKDIKPLMNESTKALFDTLHKYYDSNVLSVMFAPLFPEASRNVIWEATLP